MENQHTSVIAVIWCGGSGHVAMELRLFDGGRWDVACVDLASPPLAAYLN
jgi:hypothetical protein